MRLSPPMRIGYVRVSTGEQHLQMQRDALTAAGCERIFEDVASGSRKDRPELARMLDVARPGDVIVVWKLDRLGRSLKHLIDTLDALCARGVEFVSTTQQIDTTTPTGRLMFHVLGMFAEFERDLIRERSIAGLEAARARGKAGGRPPALTPEQITVARTLYADKSLPIAAICRTLGVSRPTFFRYMKDVGPSGGEL